MRAGGTRVRGAILGVVALAVVAGACGGSGTESSQPAEVVRAVAVRQVENGAALQETVIEVELSEPLEVVTRDAPVSSYFVIEVPSATVLDGTETIRARSARVEGDMVFVTVDRPVAMGGTLFIGGGFFGDSALEEVEVDVSSTLTAFEAALASVALQPTSEQVVTAGPAPEVIDADRDPEVMKQLLLDHLRLRGSPGGILARAEQAYDSIPPEIVPSPKLRAAIAGLTGSFAEPAIETMFGTRNCRGRPIERMAFEEIPDFPTLLARVIFDENGDRTILVRPDLEGERFEHLMPLMAHEAIHCDMFGNAEEEVAAAAFDTLLYAQLLTADPSLALEGTPLTRALNLDVIAMINSGRRYPESLGILPSDGIAQVLPGSNATARSFAEQVANSYGLPSVEDPPPEVLAQVYAAILAETAGMPEGDAFDLVYLDELIGASFDAQGMALLIAALTLQP